MYIEILLQFITQFIIKYAIYMQCMNIAVLLQCILQTHISLIALEAERVDHLHCFNVV